MPKRVLLTGASGFVGHSCIPWLLAEGFEVHAASSRPVTGSDRQPVIWHQADLLQQVDAASLIGRVKPEYLLHLAWYAEPGKYLTAHENLAWTCASLGLIEEFAAQRGVRVVTAGSCAEYDWRYGYCSEDVTPLAPRTLYGVCKHSLQLMTAAFAGQAGLSAAWGRIFFLYGPGEHPKRLVASTILALLNGRQALCTHGRQIRDYLYVEDAGRALVSLLCSQLTGPSNIASGRPVSVQSIVSLIASQLQRPELVRFGARPVPEDDPPLLVGDTRHLGEGIGWQPRYDLAGGIAATIQWWKDRTGEGSHEACN